MFLRHHPRHFQPAASIFIAFQLINVKNHLHITNYQLNLATSCLPVVRMVGWLNSGEPSLLIWHHLLNWKFSRNCVRTSCLFEKKVQ